ncbi:MAG: type II toxin-antitoxin system VapC family toxin [Candidatus Nanopelagicales bacterium]|jgi:toxin-antitoxin system PIN domain toxin
MIVPDANLLIYASDSGSLFHERAREWWTAVLNGDESVGLSWLVLVAYVRVMSSARIMNRPVAVVDLLDEIERWLTAPHVQVLQPTARHPHGLRSLLVPAGVGGDLVNDAHLAALALEYGATVYSADTDFARFSDVRWVNPLAR